MQDCASWGGHFVLYFPGLQGKEVFGEGTFEGEQRLTVRAVDSGDRVRFGRELLRLTADEAEDRHTGDCACNARGIVCVGVPVADLHGGPLQGFVGLFDLGKFISGQLTYIRIEICMFVWMVFERLFAEGLFYPVVSGIIGYTED